MNLEDLVETFDFLGDWDARYDFIAELGEKTSGLPEDEKTHATQVHGCMSQVWIVGHQRSPTDPAMSFQVDDEAPIVRGLAALLAIIYEGRTPEEVEAFDADAMFDQLGLFDHLSPQRHVGMYAMVQRLRDIARNCETKEAV